MKKVLLLMLAVCLLAPMANAQNDKAKKKELKKEYKTKMKDYKEEKWKLFGSSRSLEVALLTHYEKLSHPGVRDIPGTASRFKSKNVGHQMARNSAYVAYAQEAGNSIKGMTLSEIYGSGTQNNDAERDPIMRDNDGNIIDTSTERDRLFATYMSNVEKEIKGVMKESYSVIRELGDGTFEMQTYFIVDEDAASKARIRAMENAVRENGLAQKYAQQLSEYVQKSEVVVSK